MLYLHGDLLLRLLVELVGHVRVVVADAAAQRHRDVHALALRPHAATRAAARHAAREVAGQRDGAGRPGRQVRGHRAAAEVEAPGLRHLLRL